MPCTQGEGAAPGPAGTSHVLSRQTGHPRAAPLVTVTRVPDLKPRRKWAGPAEWAREHCGWRATVTRKGSWCATWQFPQEPNAQKVPCHSLPKRGESQRTKQRTFSHVWDGPRASPPRLPPALLSHFRSSTILSEKDGALKKRSVTTTEHCKHRRSLVPGWAVGTWRSAPDTREPVGAWQSARHDGDRCTSGDRPEDAWSWRTPCSRCELPCAEPGSGGDCASPPCPGPGHFDASSIPR